MGGPFASFAILLLYFDAEHPEIAAEHVEGCGNILNHRGDWLSWAGPPLRRSGRRSSPPPFGGIGPLLRKEHRYPKAISLLREDAEALHYWGKAFFQAGQLYRAQEKLDSSIKIYRDYGAGQSWVDRVEADCRRAQPPSAKSTSPSAQAYTDITSGEAIFRNEGEFWTICYRDRSFRLKDLKGLHYIAYLLAHPNKRFHVRELSAIVGSNNFSLATSDPSLHADMEDAPAILDSKAKADYRARLSELRAQFEEAERTNDRGRGERIREELEFVNDELSAAVGLNGRDRKMSDLAERTRVRIGKAIRSALSGIRQHDLPLGHHLTTCIRTGYYCAYLPDPQRLMSWKF